MERVIPLSTIKLLREWARWGEGHSLDYSTMSPMFGERALKTPLFGVDHAPLDILRMELAVCRLEFDDRDIIIQRWQRKRSYREMGVSFGCSTWSINRRLRIAEAEVHRKLEDTYCTTKQEVIVMAYAQ
jgi:DNA-directed RNA polymerase specialized sigma24 family protein